SQKSLHTFVIIKNPHTGITIEVFSLDKAEYKEFINLSIDFYKKYSKFKSDYLDAKYEDKEPIRIQYGERLSSQLQQLAILLQIDKIIDYINLAAPECDSLIFVPHFFLHLLPLHALPIQPSGQVLLDRFVGGIRYIPSCSLLKSLRGVRPSYDTFSN
ncbi:MAG: hypothetical protein ACKO96_47970, partial [Flammeovirgaceae bacterium]